MASANVDRISLYEEVADVKNNPDVFLIDVREPKEILETGLIPGSINIPMGQVVDEMKTDPNKFKEKYGIRKPNIDSKIIITCRSGRRAEISMNDLENIGYTRCKYYAGSWLEWVQKQPQ